MKQSLKLKLRARTRDLPHWSDVLAERSIATSAIDPRIDELLRRWSLPIWATHEYRRHARRWSPEEIASGLDRIYRLILRTDRTIPQDFLDALRLLPIVEYVHVSPVVSAELPRPRATAMSASPFRRSRDAILLDEAHLMTRGHPEVTIAVLDTGVDISHPEIAPSLLPGFDFVDIIDGAADFVGDFLDADPEPDDAVGHGTHVAGIVAAKGLRMPVGVAPRCKVIPVRVLGAMKQDGRLVGAGLVENINNGVKWAVDRGADVINMSLGVRHTGGGLPHEEVIDYARRKGVTVVAASGNGGDENLYYPGALDYVITVGATDEDGGVAGFSTWGPQVDLVAPGTEIYSAFVHGGYALSSGTSHAAPFVTGVVALLKSFALERGHRLADSQVKFLLEQTSDKVDRRFKNIRAGFGRLNARDALRLLAFKLRSRSRVSMRRAG